MERRSRFVTRQEHQPSIAAGSVPTHFTIPDIRPATQTLMPTPTSESFVSTTTCTHDTSSSSSSITTTTLSYKNPILPSAIDSVPQSSQPPVSTDGSRKYVVAHHMVGNTYPYTLDDWKEDIVLAHAAGIDGFALNMGTDSWEPARVTDA